MARLAKDERAQVEELARETVQWATDQAQALNDLSDEVRAFALANDGVDVDALLEKVERAHELRNEQKKRTGRTLAHIDPALVDVFM